MNELDIMLIAVLVVSSLMGYFKGFIKEARGVVSIIISAVVTYIYFKRGGSLLSLSLIFILTNLGLAVAFGRSRSLCGRVVMNSLFLTGWEEWLSVF